MTVVVFKRVSNINSTLNANYSISRRYGGRGNFDLVDTAYCGDHVHQRIAKRGNGMVAILRALFRLKKGGIRPPG